MNYSRAEALQRIREYLVANTHEDETTCQAAARLGVFCHGYDRWTMDQLRNLYPWLAKKMPRDTPREEFLKLITAWDGARQLVNRVTTTCDAKAIDHEGCLGFDRFNNAQLKRMFPQVFAPDDVIEPW
jgi:Iap family predicted aminopeptidase